ncbi:hypothetical protein GCM10009001_02430 [Virgibacillus siamensis]|uniref:Inner spore coat protein D n=1 Tax=Virgibacillus siamensis TaxID=480071 RepID=A0ABN1FGH8_9BACI
MKSHIKGAKSHIFPGKSHICVLKPHIYRAKSHISSDSAYIHSNFYNNTFIDRFASSFYNRNKSKNAGGWDADNIWKN